MMEAKDIAAIFALLVPIMLVWRVVPLFALKGRELNARAKRALGFIPVASFSALVANDIFDPANYVVGANPYQALVPLVCALVVFVVAKKGGSLIMCALVGLVLYASLSLVLF